MSLSAARFIPSPLVSSFRFVRLVRLLHSFSFPIFVRRTSLFFSFSFMILDLRPPNPTQPTQPNQAKPIKHKHLNHGPLFCNSTRLPSYQVYEPPFYLNLSFFDNYKVQSVWSNIYWTLFADLFGGVCAVCAACDGVSGLR